MVMAQSSAKNGNRTIKYKQRKGYNKIIEGVTYNRSNERKIRKRNTGKQEKIRLKRKLLGVRLGRYAKYTNRQRNKINSSTTTTTAST
jgi:hypothetical protein